MGKIEIIASTTNDKQGSDSLILIPGPPTELQLTIEPSEVIAGSGKTAIVTVKVYDATQHPLKGKQVSLSLSPQIGELSPIIDQSNGTYTATYTAGKVGGNVILTAEVEKITQENTITLKSPVGVIRGTVFEDLDGNKKQDVNEPGIEGVKISLEVEANIIDEKYTNKNGEYVFQGVAAGVYVVREADLDNYKSSTPNSVPVSLTVNNMEKEVNFGDYRVAGEVIQNAYSYPNPATGAKCTIRFQVAKQVDVEIQIYSILGELVISERKMDVIIGPNEFVWDISNVARGVYILKIDAEEIKSPLFNKIAVIRK